MKKHFIIFAIATIILVIAGCTHRRMSEEEYAKRAEDSAKLGMFEDSWAYYRELISYYSESKNIDMYRLKAAEVLLKIIQNVSADKQDGWIKELVRISPQSAETLLAWEKFTRAREKNEPISLQDYKLAAQYALNRGSFKDALDAYETAIKFYPSGHEIYKIYFIAGFIASEYLKNYNLARDFFRTIVERFPDCDLVDDAEWMLKNMGKPPEEIIFATDTFAEHSKKEPANKPKSSTPKKAKR